MIHPIKRWKVVWHETQTIECVRLGHPPYMVVVGVDEARCRCGLQVWVPVWQPQEVDEQAKTAKWKT